MSDQSKEEFREEQARAAAAQNQNASNAVPEQRPQATITTGDYHESDAALARREQGGEEPMDKAAFDRAQSDSQAKKAEKAGQTERLLEGARVRVENLDETFDKIYNGRTGVVLRVNFTPEGARDARSGVQHLSNFAEVESYDVRLRDEGQTTLNVTPNQVVRISPSQATRTVGATPAMI